MSAGEVVQLYAPFAGLMALAFWMGVLSQRVRQLEKGGDATAHLAADMSDVKSDVRHMKETVDDLKDRLSWVTEPAPYNVRRTPRSKE